MMGVCLTCRALLWRNADAPGQPTSPRCPFCMSSSADFAALNVDARALGTMAFGLAWAQCQADPARAQKVMWS